ncbi:MAG: Ldh family oxidoreductase [Thermomicrobiales bacterium]
MYQVAGESLHRFARELLVAAGATAESAALVADSLLDANLAGHDSHGVLRLPGYLAGVKNGHLRPEATPALISRSGATAIVDANEGWGQPAMWLATEAAVEAAHEFGLGAAVVHRSYHIGRVAPYVEAIARAGMIGFATANAAPAVAPFGGRKRVFGTNPIAWAAPRAEDAPPVSLDVATAGIAEGKLRVARARGLSVPAGNVIDRDGQPSTDPADFYAGGALLPFGGHKGSGFSLLAQILGRGLAGMDPSAYDGPRGVNGPFILAIDVGRFTPLDVFRTAVEAQCAAVTSCEPGAGVPSVLLPGQPELANREFRQEHGVPVPESTWQELLTLAAEWGVAPPSDLAEAPAGSVR